MQIFPLSSDNLIFSVIMSKGQVEKPFQLVSMESFYLSFMQFSQLNDVPYSCAQEIPSHLHCHLPEELGVRVMRR